MPCFKPLKDHMIRLTGELIDRYGIQGPFLEIGCGDGTFAEMLGRLGMEGTAIDLSEEAVAATRRRTAHREPKTEVLRIDAMDFVPARVYGLAVLYDVLEHVAQDRVLLDRLADWLCPRGYALLSFPVKMALWGWDDDFHGHLRRYEQRDIECYFQNDRFAILEQWDITFPFIHGLRTLYLWCSAVKAGPPDRASRTQRSAFAGAAGTGRLVRCVEAIPLWRPLMAVQNLFRRRRYGCNTLLLVRKRT